MIEQARFAMFPLVVCFCLLAVAQGGSWAWFGVYFFIFGNLIVDDISSDYFYSSSDSKAGYYTVLLWSIPPLMLALHFVVLMKAAPVQESAISLNSASGFGLLEFIGMVASYGIIVGMAGVSYAHELIHRPTRTERFLGQFLLTLAVHPSIAIEHVYGHHRYACTLRDPTLAPRGMGFWRYLVKSYFGEIFSAAAFEKKRLSKRGQSSISISNRFLQGMVLLALLLTNAWWLAGSAGLFVFLAGGFTGLVMIELGNYITHYGIIREPDQPMEPRHSWNAPRFFSTSVLINAPRHSDHHSHPEAPYWKLAVPEEAPRYNHGNFMMSVFAMVPPLWFRITAPMLADWDHKWATPGELALVRKTQVSS